MKNLIVRRGIGAGYTAGERAPVIVLRTADGKRCDKFTRSPDSIRGPFFGFAGSTNAWRAAGYVGAGDFGTLVVAVSDASGELRAIYEHPNNVNMDAGYTLSRVAVSDTDGIPAVTSSSGADGDTDAYVELFGLAADGEPRVLFSTSGRGLMPHAEASVTVRVKGERPEIDAVTSHVKSPSCTYGKECLVCTKVRHAWQPATSSFERVTDAGPPARVACP